MSGKKNGIVPDDGSYLGAKKGKALRDKKIQDDFNNAWVSQKQLLKSCLVKLYKDKSSIGVQWSTMLDWDNSLLTAPRRIKRALNSLNRGKFPLTANATNQAVQIAQEIDLKIKADAFDWQDYSQWLPKGLKPKAIKLSERKITIQSGIENFIADYWLYKDQNKYQDHLNLRTTYLRYYKRIKQRDTTRPTKEILDTVAREYPKSVNRNKCCSALKKLAPYLGLKDYDPKQYRLKKQEIEIKAPPKRHLSDQEIEEWFDKFPHWEGIKKKSHWQLWQWIYGMQATYGFRNHEVLNIYNLTKPYIDEKGNRYEAFVDTKNNPRGIIYTRGKGIERAAFLPQPIKWLNRFKLRNIPELYFIFLAEISGYSDYKKEKRKAGKLSNYENFLNKHDYPFTAYNLRHAYNVKSHGLGIPVSLIAKNLGHTIQQNTTTYLESQGIKSCLDALDNWEKRQQNKIDSNLSIEAQLDLLRQENEQLKAIIQQLLESIKSDS